MSICFDSPGFIVNSLQNSGIVASIHPIVPLLSTLRTISVHGWMLIAHVDEFLSVICGIFGIVIVSSLILTLTIVFIGLVSFLGNKNNCIVRDTIKARIKRLKSFVLSIRKD